MSRSEQDLQRRLDILVKALEKEQNDKKRSMTSVTKSMAEAGISEQADNFKIDIDMESFEE
jgi:hypothetical protein